MVTGVVMFGTVSSVKGLFDRGLLQVHVGLLAGLAVCELQTSTFSAALADVAALFV